MVNISTRMRKLNTLLAIRLGPGAAILPPNVSRIHLEMAKDIAGGHHGSRRFWRTMLPKLAYHNPSTPMTVHRHEDPDGPSLLSVYLASSDPNTLESTPQQAVSAVEGSAQVDAPANEDAPAIQIDMKSKQESAILEEFLRATNARPVEPTQEEIDLMRELEEQKARGEVDSVRSKAFRAQWKKEMNMLKAAREGAL